MSEFERELRLSAMESALEVSKRSIRVEAAVEGGGSDAIVAGSAHRLVEDRRALPAMLERGAGRR